MTKPKIAWITDSTSSLNKEFIDKNHIYIVPLNVVINGESYKETVEMTEEELYTRMLTEEGTFQTSQPSVGEFMNLYEQLKEEYDFGIAFHASSKLSGTYNTSVMAAEMVGFKLYSIDSLTGSYPLSYIIHKGIELIGQGTSVENVIKQLNEIRNNTRLYLIPASLDQLHKSGRASGSQKLLASLFNIKPILAIEEGKAIIKDKVRSQKRAQAWVMNQLKADKEANLIKKVAILHANDLQSAKEWEKQLHEEMPEVEIEIKMLISVAGVHTGVQTIGLAWVCE